MHDTRKLVLGICICVDLAYQYYHDRYPGEESSWYKVHNIGMIMMGTWYDIGKISAWYRYAYLQKTLRGILQEREGEIFCKFWTIFSDFKALYQTIFFVYLGLYWYLGSISIGMNRSLVLVLVLVGYWGQLYHVWGYQNIRDISSLLFFILSPGQTWLSPEGHISMTDTNRVKWVCLINHSLYHGGRNIF